MEKKVSWMNRVAIALTILLLLISLSYSLFPSLEEDLPFNQFGLIASFIGLILVVIVVKVLRGFDTEDRNTLVDIQNNLPSLIPHLQYDHAREDDIRKSIKSCTTFWILATTGAGLYYKYGEELKEGNKTDKRMIVYEGESQAYKLLRKIPESEKEHYDYTEHLKKRRKEKVEIRLANELPGYNLLILNPPQETSNNIQNSKIYVWIKEFGVGKETDYSFLIRPSDNNKVIKSLYMEMINRYNRRWSLNEKNTFEG